MAPSILFSTQKTGGLWVCFQAKSNFHKYYHRSQTVQLLCIGFTVRKMRERQEVPSSDTTNQSNNTSGQMCPHKRLSRTQPCFKMISGSRHAEWRLQVKHAVSVWDKVPWSYAFLFFFKKQSLVVTSHLSLMSYKSMHAFLQILVCNSPTTLLSFRFLLPN